MHRVAAKCALRLLAHDQIGNSANVSKKLLECAFHDKKEISSKTQNFIRLHVLLLHSERSYLNG